MPCLQRPGGACSQPASNPPARPPERGSPACAAAARRGGRCCLCSQRRTPVPWHVGGCVVGHARTHIEPDSGVGRQGWGDAGWGRVGGADRTLVTPDADALSGSTIVCAAGSRAKLASSVRRSILILHGSWPRRSSLPRACAAHTTTKRWLRRQVLGGTGAAATADALLTGLARSCMAVCILVRLPNNGFFKWTTLHLKRAQTYNIYPGSFMRHFTLGALSAGAWVGLDWEFWLTPIRQSVLPFSVFIFQSNHGRPFKALPRLPNVHPQTVTLDPTRCSKSGACSWTDSASNHITTTVKHRSGGSTAKA